MKHLLSYKLFEKLTRSERNEYYRKIRGEAIGVVVPQDELHKYNIPQEIIDMMIDWEVRFKSPYSNTFYNTTDISWSYKPDGSLRVSDHWNFYTNDKWHCQTDTKVPNNSHVSIAKYDRKIGRYHIIKSVETDEHVEKLTAAIARKEYLKNPERIARMKEFKNRIANKEIYIKLNHKDKNYEGIVKKWTGTDLKIEDENGNPIFSDNYFSHHSKDEFNLFDKSGNKIDNPY